MNKEGTFPWGERYWLSKVTGVASGINQSTEQNVRSVTTNQLTYLGKAGVGNVPVTNHYTETSHRTSFWLTDADGKEVHYDLPCKLPIREGHTVTVVWGAKKRKSSGNYKYVYNHNTGEGEVTDGYCWNDWRYYSSVNLLIKLFIIYVIAFFLNGLFVGSVIAGVFMGFLWTLVSYPFLSKYLIKKPYNFAKSVVEKFAKE